MATDGGVLVTAPRVPKPGIGGQQSGPGERAAAAPDGNRYIPCRHDNGTCLDAAGDITPRPGPAGLDVEMTPCMTREELWI